MDVIKTLFMLFYGGEMNILVIGQCTLHWGRMEFGNIGNYYIVEPFIRELHRVFPKANIKTTMQMSERFCKAEKISVVPLDLFYGWTGDDLEQAKEELFIAENYKIKKQLINNKTTPYIEEVLQSDLVIDFSGDIWGDNANFLGTDRFMVGLIKDHVAKLLGKKVVMLAGSPGPFSNEDTRAFAQQVYKEFDLVTNREPVSIDILNGCGFDTSNTYSLACPAFLFKPASIKKIGKIIEKEGIVDNDGFKSKPVVGFIICGWNFEQGPFDKENRTDYEFEKFAKAVEYLTEELDVRVCLMSHSNGFDIPPAPFKLKHGRDYVVAKQLEKVLLERGVANDFFVIDGVYDAWETAGIIKSFDMLVSGRVHAAVAGLSQFVPTVIIDYGHEPKAHKLIGFATVVQVLDYVADPCDLADIKIKMKTCWDKRSIYIDHLKKRIPEVKQLAKQNFDLLKEIVR